MLRHGLLLGLASIAIAGPPTEWRRWAEEHTPRPRIDGTPIHFQASAVDQVSKRATARLDERVRVLFAGRELSATRREIGGWVDVNATAREVETLRRPSKDLRRGLHTWMRALRSSSGIPLKRGIDANKTLAYAKGVETLLRDGELELDTEMAAYELAAVALGNTTSVTLPTVRRTRPNQPVPSGQVVMATYETEYPFIHQHRSRAHNVELAASRLDGAVIPPHGVLSFNERVGSRTRRQGFKTAHVILNGEITDGMGGGVCQVASTLYAAAVFAGLEFEEHRPHSRPSTYIDMGLDATVVWPDIDLRIQNPFDFPIEVQAGARDGLMQVKLVGASKPRVVTLRSEVLSRSGYRHREVVSPELEKGQRRTVQRGMLGARIRRVRTIREGGRSTEWVDELRYPSTDHVVATGA